MSYYTDWHYVGDTGKPAYSTGFTGDTRFRKGADGVVFLELHVSGSVKGTIFTLPIGYRPTNYMLSFIASDNVYGGDSYNPIIYIYTDGRVYLDLNGYTGIVATSGNTSFYVGPTEYPGTDGEDGATGATGETGATGPGFETYNSTTTYGENAIVASMGAAYLSVQGNNTNHTPGTDTAWWKESFKITSAYDVYSGGSASVENTDNIIDGGN